MPSKKSYKGYKDRMSVLVILGLEPAERQDLFGLLRAQGVSAALPGKSHALSPDAISAAVVKDLKKRARVPAGKVVGGRKVQAKPAARPKAGKFLSDIASDLFLANMDADVWGWQDATPMAAQDFWSDFDESVRFLFVYTTPEAHFLDVLAREPTGPVDARAELSRWVAFHEEALAFAARHRGRCLFINAENLRERTADYVQDLHAAGLTLHADTEPHFVPRAHADAGLIGRFLATKTLADFDDTAEVLQQLEAVEMLGGGMPLPLPTVAELLTEHRHWVHEHLQLRQALGEAMQALSASEATHEAERQALQAAQGQSAAHAQSLEQRLAKAEAEDKQKLEALQAVQSQSAAHAHGLEQKLAKSEAHHQQKLEALQAEATKLGGQIAELTQQNQAASRSAQSNEELRKENDLILAQLHQVQEELEHYYLENIKLRAVAPVKVPHADSQAALFEYWRTHQPAEFWLDFRDGVPGNNWYEAEAIGRWAGPGLESTIKLPPLVAGRYTAELEVMDAMAPELLESIEARFGDAGCTKRLSRVSGDAPYPALLELDFEVAHSNALAVCSLRLLSERLYSPSESGSDDTRHLGVFVRAMRVVKQHASISN